MNLLIQEKIKKQQNLGLRIKYNKQIVSDKANKQVINTKKAQSVINVGNPHSIENLQGKSSSKEKPKDGRWIVL